MLLGAAMSSQDLVIYSSQPTRQESLTAKEWGAAFSPQIAISRATGGQPYTHLANPPLPHLHSTYHPSLILLLLLLIKVGLGSTRFLACRLIWHQAPEWVISADFQTEWVLRWDWLPVRVQRYITVQAPVRLGNHSYEIWDVHKLRHFACAKSWQV